MDKNGHQKWDAVLQYCAVDVIITLPGGGDMSGDTPRLIKQTQKNATRALPFPRPPHTYSTHIRLVHDTPHHVAWSAGCMWRSPAEAM